MKKMYYTFHEAFFIQAVENTAWMYIYQKTMKSTVERYSMAKVPGYEIEDGEVFTRT